MNDIIHSAGRGEGHYFHSYIIRYYRSRTKYDGKVIFSVCLFTRGGGGRDERGGVIPQTRTGVRCGRYASCVHAGGLSSCFALFHSGKNLQRKLL